MKRNDDGLYEMDSSNIDEVLYRVYGQSSRNVFWKTKTRIKWILEGLGEKLTGSKEVMKFLHSDLRSLRYIKAKRTPTRLRFLNKNGELKSGRFIVTFRWGSFHIKEARYPSIINGKVPKGPITIKEARCERRYITWCGFVRTWEIDINSTI